MFWLNSSALGRTLFGRPEPLPEVRPPRQDLSARHRLLLYSYWYESAGCRASLSQQQLGCHRGWVCAALHPVNISTGEIIMLLAYVGLTVLQHKVLACYF